MMKSAIIRIGNNQGEIMKNFDKNNKRDPYVWIDINLKIIQDNYKCLKRFVTPAIYAAILKADAYGLGAVPIGKALFQAGCRHFFVAYLDEADRFSEGLKELSAIPSKSVDSHHYCLCVLDGPFIHGWCQDVYKHHYIPVLNTLSNVEEWNNFAKSIGERLPAILHIDTGLHRLGMTTEEYLIFKTKNFDGIEWKFFMSHPAASSIPEHPANVIQPRRVQAIRKDFPQIPFSYADTSCMLLGKEYHFDMVRGGLALYGLNIPLEGIHNCMTVYGTVLQIQEVPEGHGIGYDWEFITDKVRRVATVSCGYADGVTKNSGLSILNFSIHGKKARILGRISMDLSVVDITDIEDVKVGDHAVIIGEESSIEDFAAASGFSFYKILTGFSHRAQRFFIH